MNADVGARDSQVILDNICVVVGKLTELGRSLAYLRLKGKNNILLKLVFTGEAKEENKIFLT